MKNENVKRATISLNLQKKIIGVKFIDLKKDFDSLNIPAPIKSGPICFLAREAMDGKMFKAVEENITCTYSKYALGLSKPDNKILEGRSYQYCGLYETNSIAKQIVNDMKYISHEIYGIVMGPLELMEDADIVIIADYAENIMRVMEGYAYKFGNPKNLSFFGNQAMCSDLISKPYSNNDINVSLMCKGTRANGRFEKGELALAFPLGMFDSIVDGIVKIINPILNSNEKKRILNELDNKDDLGIEIDMNYNYVLKLKEYGKRLKDIDCSFKIN